MGGCTRGGAEGALLRTFRYQPYDTALNKVRTLR